MANANSGDLLPPGSEPACSTANTTNPSLPGLNKRKLIVNYLPQSLSDADFFQLFVSVGPLVSSRVMRDRETGYSFGYGFVEFESEEDALKAINDLNGMSLQNKRLKVSYARPPGLNTKDTNLFVGNLGPETTSDDLNRLFAPFGHIIKTNVLRDAGTGKCRGSGFVLMAESAAAMAAIAALNDVAQMEGSSQKLTVKVAHEGKQKTMHYLRFVRNGPQTDSFQPQQPNQYRPRGQNRYHPFNRGYDPNSMRGMQPPPPGMPPPFFERPPMPSIMSQPQRPQHANNAPWY